MSLCTGLEVRSLASRDLSLLDAAAETLDLFVSDEQQGELDKARAAYEKAAALEPNNPLIRQNFDLFKEINDRTGRTDGR